MRKKVIRIIVCILVIVIISIGLYYGYHLMDNTVYEPLTKYTARFVRNGSDEIGSSKIDCKTRSGECEIILPDISVSDGYVLGWNIVDSKESLYKVGDTVKIHDDTVFYAVIYREYTLTVASENLDYISDNNLSCRVYNKDDGCYVVIPNYNKKGHENRGYSTRSDALTGVIFPNNEYLLKKDTTIYPVYNTLTRGRVIDIEDVIYKDGMIIEIENGCNKNVVNEYLDYLEKINSKAKYLLIGSKITFLVNNTFDNVWGSEYAGMNYGPTSLRLFDIRCSNLYNNDYYATFVHELSHTWDFYYGNYYGRSISDENDIMNLYAKYLMDKTHPFREYSYTSVKEFFADMVRYYYFKYIDENDAFTFLNYPSDIKNVLEKYICIANNDYNSNQCIN